VIGEALGTTCQYKGCGGSLYTWNSPWGAVDARSNSGCTDQWDGYGLAYECVELINRFMLHDMFGETSGHPQWIGGNAGYPMCDYARDHLGQYYDVYGPNWYIWPGPKPVVGDALEWQFSSSSFHTALVIETSNSDNHLGILEQNTWCGNGGQWPTDNVQWTGSNFTDRNGSAAGSVCWIHAKKNVTCAVAGAKCGKQSDCCGGSTCEGGACMPCPADSSNGCSWNGCGGAPACALAIDPGAPASVVVRVYNQSGAAWPAASTAIGTASGGDSALAAPGWISRALAVRPAGDVAPSDAATFVVPLAVPSDEGATAIAEQLDVFVGGAAQHAIVQLSVTAAGDGGLGASIDRVQAPEAAPAGTRVPVSLVLGNTGSRTWRAGHVSIALVSASAAMRDPSWPSAQAMATLAADVTPGKSATVDFYIALPDGATGIMAAEVQLADDAMGRFGPPIELAVEAVAPPSSGCALAGPPRSTPWWLTTALLGLALRRRRTR
jgi:hypothetical protein